MLSGEADAVDSSTSPYISKDIGDKRGLEDLMNKVLQDYAYSQEVEVATSALPNLCENGSTTHCWPQTFLLEA